MTLWLQGCKAALKITQADNGFILEWEKERPKTPAHYQSGPGQYEPDPRGVEIILTRADLLKRIEALIT